MKNFQNQNFQNKTVIVRVDFNVPLDKDMNIIDTKRITSSIPTIKKIISDNGKVILISHMGRPKGVEKKLSLISIKSTLSNALKKEVLFFNDCIGDDIVKKCKNANMKSVILLENLRFHKEESTIDPNFAKELSKLGDVFVNDAFGAIHRKNTSICELPKLFKEKYIGPLLEKELRMIDKIINSNNKPVTAIIGGVKVSTKLPVINNLIEKVDNIIIGGAMVYTFIKAQGGQIGKSLVEEKFLNHSLEILKHANDKGVNILLPDDTIVAKEFKNNSPQKNIAINKIPDEYIGLDIGEKSIKKFSNVILNSNTILWNGPMGVFEMPNFANGTIKIGNAIAKATKKGAFSLIGGGESASAAKQFNIEKDISYISTGGGAILEAFEGKILPGIDAMKK